MKVGSKEWISVLNSRMLVQENAFKPSGASNKVTPRNKQGGGILH